VARIWRKTAEKRRFSYFRTIPNGEDAVEKDNNYSNFPFAAFKTPLKVIVSIRRNVSTANSALHRKVQLDFAKIYSYNL
jgi:hypothetical protein